MLLTLFNIVYVFIAVAMTILILLQRGAGAQAGSGFGAGASGTVFGARGASNFLSRSTAVLALIFFVLSLAMAWYLKNAGTPSPTNDDLGVMGALATPKATEPAAPTGTVTSAPAASDVPAAPATRTSSPATGSKKPVIPTLSNILAPLPVPAPAETKAETKKDEAKKDPPAAKH
jgi:preprotein translocase subunit SecG